MISRILPAVINWIEAIYGSSFVNSNEGMRLVVTTANFLVVLNSATNFLLYLLCGNQFRLDFFRVIYNLIAFCLCQSRKLTSHYRPRGGSEASYIRRNTVTSDTSDLVGYRRERSFSLRNPSPMVVRHSVNVIDEVCILRNMHHHLEEHQHLLQLPSRNNSPFMSVL